MNIRNVLTSYYIELINATTTAYTLPSIYSLSIQPLPFYIAQLCYSFVHCCGAHMVALGSAIACTQIAYAVKFDTLFLLDPYEMGRKILFALTLLILLPNAIVAIYNTYHGFHVARGVALLTQSDYVGTGIRFLPTFTLCWTILFMVSSAIAFILIPIIFKQKQQNQTDQLPQEKIKSLQRRLLGSLSLLIILISAVILSEKNDSRQVPQTTYVLFFSFDLLLAFHLTGREVSMAVRKYLFCSEASDEADEGPTHIFDGTEPPPVANSEVVINVSSLDTLSGKTKVIKNCIYIFY